MTDLSTIVHAQRAHFLAVSSDPSIQFEREAGFAMQILQGNEYLWKVGAGNQQSLAAAITNVAAIGISLNPASKLAYLVPRDGKVCLDISYMGLMHIAQQSTAIKWGQARTVRQNDTFVMRGIDETPTHTFDPFSTDRGEIIGAYVVIKTDEGDYLTHAMSIGKINEIRDRSPQWKNNRSGPWKTDYEEMVKKTVVKQAAKMWPRRDRLDQAIHNLNTDGEGITLNGDATEKMDEAEIEEWIKAIEQTDTKEKAKGVWGLAVKACKEADDIDASNRIKSSLIAHGARLDAIPTAERVPGADDE